MESQHKKPYYPYIWDHVIGKYYRACMRNDFCDDLYIHSGQKIMDQLHTFCRIQPDDSVALDDSRHSDNNDNTLTKDILPPFNPQNIAMIGFPDKPLLESIRNVYPNACIDFVCLFTKDQWPCYAQKHALVTTAYRDYNVHIKHHTHEQPLPIEHDYYDLIIANHSMGFLPTMDVYFFQLFHALRLGGIFVGSLLSNGSFKSLGDGLAHVEQAHKNGISPRILPLWHPSDIGGLLQSTKFRDCFVDIDRHQLEYSHVNKALYDIQTSGFGNFLGTRNKHLNTQTLFNACDHHLKQSNNKDHMVFDLNILYFLGRKR